MGAASIPLRDEAVASAGAGEGSPPGAQGCKSPVSVDNRSAAVARTPPIMAWLWDPAPPTAAPRRGSKEELGAAKAQGTNQDGQGPQKRDRA